MLRYGDATLALVYTHNSTEMVRSAFVWPECHTLLHFPDGILLHLVVSAPDTKPLPVHVVVQRLQFELFSRFDGVENDALAHDFEGGRVTKDDEGKGVVLAPNLWLRYVAGGPLGSNKEHSLKVSVQHHLAYFALVRALRRPNPLGFKCRNGLAYHIRVDESDPVTVGFAKRVKLDTDAVVIEQVFRSVQASGIGPDHVFTPNVADPNKAPGRVHVTIAPSTPNPLEAATSDLWPANEAVCYSKHDGRFVLQLTTKKRTLSVMLATSTATRSAQEDESWVMVDGMGTLIPSSQLAEYQALRAEEQAEQLKETKRLIATRNAEVTEREERRAARLGVVKTQEPPKKRVKLDSFLIVTKKSAATI